MPLFESDDWRFAEAATDLVITNPFQPSWLEKQRDLLGKAAQDLADVYAWRPGWGLWGPTATFPDVARLGDRIDDLGERLRQRLIDGIAASEAELDRYEILATYRLYRHYGEKMDCLIDGLVRAGGPAPDWKGLWRDFRREHETLLRSPERRFPLDLAPEHLFACFFLLRRAFYHIFFNIIGSSKPVARLRSAVWESIVTHDLRGWSQRLFQRMTDFPTLITGPSGTGKELVAQAIGRSLYIPWDATKKMFATDFLSAFQPVNLAALPPQLIESELFGHVKGAFSFAVRDRKGRLEDCPDNGAVFLDEIGELTAELQVKLLRVLQTGHFQRVGENANRQFAGKIIAATNRDLGEEMQARRFREDFYFRLCADRITTPSLREQLQDRPEDLAVMVDFISRRVVGEDKAAGLTQEVVAWITQHPQLGADYGWPGNFRELEQCVRSYILRKEYRPLAPRQPAEIAVAEACAVLSNAVLNRTLTYDEIERRLCSLVHARTGSYQEAAKLLQCDWRTLRARVTTE